MSKKGPEPKQWLIVIGAAILIIVLSVISTVYLKEGGDSVTSMGRQIASTLGFNFYSPTMTDAHMACEKATKSNFGKRIRVFHVDMFSSHEDLAEGLYKMYVNVELYEFANRKGRAWSYLMGCQVSAASGRVAIFTLVRSESPKAPAIGGKDSYDLVL